jgi:hypothetical protein
MCCQSTSDDIFGQRAGRRGAAILDVQAIPQSADASRNHLGRNLDITGRAIPMRGGLI